MLGNLSGYRGTKISLETADYRNSGFRRGEYDEEGT